MYKHLASFGIILAAGLLLLFLTSCGGTEGPPGLEVNNYQGTVEEVFLSDGTRCAIWWEDITCDWRER